MFDTMPSARPSGMLLPQIWPQVHAVRTLTFGLIMVCEYHSEVRTRRFPLCSRPGQ